MNKSTLIFNTLLIFLFSCESNDYTREQLSNVMGDKGRSNSYEYIERFPQQLYNDYTIKETSGAITAPIFLNDESTVIGTADNKIISVKQRKVNWEFELDSGRLVSNYMAADSVGNVYAVDNQGGIYSIKDGKLNWKSNIPKDRELTVFNGVLSTKSGIYFSSSNGIIKSFKEDGTLSFEKQFENTILNPLSYAEDNLLVVNSYDEFGKTDTLYSLDNEGNINWKYFKEGFRILKGVITNGKNIALGIAKQGGSNPLAMLINLDLEGKSKWEREIALLPRHLSISKEGEIFMITYSRIPSALQNGVYCYDTEGEIKWNIYYDYSITTPAMISQEQISFMGSNRKTYGYFFLNKDTGVLEKTITIADAAPINFLANVDMNGVVTFTGSNKLRLVKIDETPMEKILPY